MKQISSEMIGKFKIRLINEEKSQATQEKYIRDITSFVKWNMGQEITKLRVLEYKEHLVRTYAPASVNSMLSSLNSFFMFCEWQDLKVKFLKLQRQFFASKEKELTKAEYERLLTAAKAKGNRKLYYMMQTICSTGIRVSELKYITLESLKKKQAVISLKGKTRIIIIPDFLCRLLLKYTKDEKIESGAVFISKNGKVMDRSNIWKSMKNLCKSANVRKEKVFPHNLRHLFARTYYTMQKDIVRLADILGHSSINSIRIYTMETVVGHRRQIQKLGLLRC